MSVWPDVRFSSRSEHPELLSTRADELQCKPQRPLQGQVNRAGSVSHHRDVHLASPHGEQCINSSAYCGGLTTLLARLTYCWCGRDLGIQPADVQIE